MEEIKQVPMIIQLSDILGRRKALLSGCILTALSIGLVVYLLQPKVFQSESLLSYKQQMVNTGRMVPDDNSKVKDVVSSLTQIVTSRSSLEKIIVNEKLYQKEREGLPMEDVVELMRKNISVVPSRNGDTFKIAYTASEQSKVARVANALAGRFIEENMKYREERASANSAYTEEELGIAKKMLDAKEEVMRDYKLKYFNEMSDQHETNMTRLISLQNYNQSRLESIQNLERTRAILRDQIAMRKESLGGRMVTPVPTDPAQVPGPQQTLARLYAELQDLQLKYKEEHPKIINLKSKIAKLEQSAVGKEPGTKPQAAEVDKTLANLELQMRDIDSSISKFAKERERAEGQISQYEKWVAAAPVREAEWSALTREYGELKKHYDFLVAQNLQADSALNLEKKQRGSQFTIEDAAQQPIKPVKPDFFKVMAVALLLGGGAGIGGSLLLEKLNTTIRFPEEIEAAFQLEVLCSVPRLPLQQEVTRKRIFTAIGAFAFVSWAIMLSGALAVFWKQGRIIF